MSDLIILCVEDEPEVRDALLRDLAVFEPVFTIEAADNVADAREVLRECVRKGWRLALALCDHLLPGENGTQFLVELRGDPEFSAARKVLVTGQAGLQDTIRAVNEAGLDYYIAKPWTAEQLHSVVRRLLSDYVIEQEENLLPFVQALDSPRLLEALRSRRADT